MIATVAALWVVNVLTLLYGFAQLRQHTGWATVAWEVIVLLAWVAVYAGGTLLWNLFQGR